MAPPGSKSTFLPDVNSIAHFFELRYYLKSLFLVLFLELFYIFFEKNDYFYISFCKYLGYIYGRIFKELWQIRDATYRFFRSQRE